MKRRAWLVASVASLVASSLGLSPALAQTPAAQSRFVAGSRYEVRDSYVKPASATAAGTASASAAAVSHMTSAASMDSCCDTCGTCDPCAAYGAGLWDIEGEVLLWFRKSRALPPLVATDVLPAGDILFGNDNYGDDLEVGGRLTVTRWLGQDRVWGIAADGFGLGQSQTSFSLTAAPGQTLVIPFINSAGNVPDALVVDDNGVTADNGSVDVLYQNDVFGGDVYARRLIYAEESISIDAIGGYQFSRVDDGISIRSAFEDSGGLPGDTFDISDQILARNEFHGGVVGVIGQVDCNRWTIKALAKCGIGNMRQTVTYAGQTIATSGGVATVSQGGLFALEGANLGEFTNDEFVIIPEAKLNIGYRVSEHWTFSAGYSFMYWNKLVTAGQAIDTTINENFLPGGNQTGPIRPAAPTFVDLGDFWVQGINLSAEFSY